MTGIITPGTLGQPPAAPCAVAVSAVSNEIADPPVTGFADPAGDIPFWGSGPTRTLDQVGNSTGQYTP